ncbi:ABC transporter permease [Pseudarthrobacter sulfonivorans]|uniref:ABC transporter permease n=1 Tax=Pseudarthrobacter sulfonivorans TaxID=121292 RepID=UPI0027870738|nr:ABC transporter permease subunit [Pseudarthrobacter sulfonivorans]MDQ0000614.1 osmoprotectant transport system permease protein [Pseudarthrobacter sulfonivorans]
MTLLFEALNWLSDSARWSGPTGIFQRVFEHLAVTAGVVFIAAAIALPLGVLVGHTRRGRTVVAALAGAARAIPTLGLLTVLGLALGIGLQAPVLALVVLAVPSLLAGAYAGVENVSAPTVDAARASGMSELQIILRVELPLASPIILGGLRAATLQVVATATLAAYVADVGLGRYLYAGLKTRDYPQMLAGAVLLVILALLLEIALSAVQRAGSRAASPNGSMLSHHS